jgi:hypothetical protein
MRCGEILCDQNGNWGLTPVFWDLAMAIGVDTFEFNGIHAYQLAGMCEECKLPQKQVAIALRGLCASLAKAVDRFDLSQHLIGDEPVFGQRMLDGIKANCQRFLELSTELPDVKL